MTTPNAYTVRLVCTADIQGYFRLIRNNRHRLHRIFPELVALTRTAGDTALYIAHCINAAERNDQYEFVIEDIRTGELIGSVQVKITDGLTRKGQIGYYIDEAAEGKGVLSRALGEVVDFCFSFVKLNKVLVSIDERNGRGRKVAVKNGFTPEARIRNCRMTATGETINLLHYGLVNPAIQ